ncbi:MAG: 50S ribosomal protein L11 methyltransferase [Terriglobales bacterium]
MIKDPLRFPAYLEALRRTVKPGSVVLDMGTGPGIMALLACRFGARKVYAIEPDPIIQVAREIAAGNGLAGRIEFIEGFSTHVSLPERVDVIVSDLNGILPWYQQHLRAVADARQRFLAPGGVMIPKKETVWLGVVESPQVYSEHAQAWETGHGFEMHAARDLAINTRQLVRLRSEDLLAAPQCGVVLDFMQVERPDSKADATFVITRPGVGHGLLVWFDCALTDEIFFSNAPGCYRSGYGQTFFPWTRPVNLQAGDVVRLKLRCNLVADDYVYRWITEVLGKGEKAEVKASFDQSDFRSFPISPASLRKGSEAYVPRCTGDGSTDRFILTSMDGKASVGEIAACLSERFPDRFKERSEALDRVARVSRAYSE